MGPGAVASHALGGARGAGARRRAQALSSSSSSAQPARRTYAVTGGTGFLGGELVRRLVDAGHVVRVVARGGRPGPLLAALDNVEVLDGAVDGPGAEDALAEAFEGADGVFALAGVVQHSRSASARARCESVNVGGTLNTVRAAVRARVPRVVLASTSGVAAVSAAEPEAPIGDADGYADEVVARWPYYATKLDAERKALAYARGAGLELVALRPSLLLGPGDLRLSSCRSLLDLLEGRVPFTPSGGMSLVDVRDAAAAFEAAMDRGTPGATYLLGAENLTVAEYFARVAAVSGVRAPWLRVPTAVGWWLAAAAHRAKRVLLRYDDPTLDPVVVEMAAAFWYLDASRAAADLGFAPRPADDTLRDTVAYLRAHRAELAA